MRAAALAFLVVVVAPNGVTGATVPGGGNARTDCLLQLSAEGVGFPAG